MPPRKKKPELTHEEALQKIAELEAALAAKEEAPAPSATPDQMAHIQSLAAALQATRKQANAAKSLAETATQEPVYEVKNLIGATVSVNVTDSRGNPKNIMFATKGVVQYLTGAQIMELYDKYPVLFEKGYLQAPEVLPASHNAVENYDAFIDGVAYDEIDDRIAALDSPDVLIALFYHIENRRFRTEDEDGKPYRDARGKPEIREVPLDAKTRMLAHAIAARVKELTQVEEFIGTDAGGNPLTMMQNVVLLMDGSGE